jgi:hypothetical protein
MNNGPAVRRPLLHFACALLLLVAQHAALTHSVWHLHDHLPTHGQHEAAGTANPDEGDERPFQSGLCDLHLALGSLLAGDCVGTPAAVAVDSPHALAPAPAVGYAARPTPTPRSRAPPVLL